MIPDMPRQRPPHLNHERTRHGKYVWVVRVGKGPRIRLRAPYDSPEFKTQYDDAVAGRTPVKRGKAAGGSLQWLWDGYRETGAWTELSMATRKQRENIMVRVLKESGHKPFIAIRDTHIQAGIDRRAKTPNAARNFLDTMKGLFRWAKKRSHIKADPTLGVEPPTRKKVPGFPAWTRDDIAAYYLKYPLGTRQRVWLDVLLYTGPRRGDAVMIGKQHVKNGIATFKTEKSGETVTVTLPILPVLQRTLDAGPTGDLAWICGARGEPFTKESFGNAFSEAARAAGIKKSAHGVRKIAATIAAENGATGPELDAIFGWVDGGRTSAIYIREANRVRLAAQAIGKLDETRTDTPAPIGKVRANRQKP